MTKTFNAETVGGTNPITYSWSITGTATLGTNGNPTIDVIYQSNNDLVGAVLTCVVKDAFCTKTITLNLDTNILIIKNITAAVACDGIIEIDTLGSLQYIESITIDGAGTGEVLILPSKKVKYTAIGGGYTDTFTYQLTRTDGIQSNVANITINVAQCVQNCNMVISIQNLNYLNGEIAFDVMRSGTFEESDYSMLANMGTISHSVINGGLHYVITDVVTSTYIFTAKIENENCNVIDTKSIDVVVYQAPQLVNDTYTTQKGQMLTMAVLNNDTDPANGTLEITHINGTAIQQNVSMSVSNGTIVVSGSVVQFTPNSSYVGSMMFLYTAKSSVSNLSSVGSATIEVICLKPLLTFSTIILPVASNEFTCTIFVTANGITGIADITVINNVREILTITAQGNDLYKIEIQDLEQIQGTNTAYITATNDCGNSLITKNFTR